MGRKLTRKKIEVSSMEGKDRFIDEFGTQAIWLWGIPAYKKAIDFSIYAHP